MADEFAYDVFLSHNSMDKPFVRRLAERLRDEGLRVWFDEWAIKPGDDIFLAIETGLQESRTQVLCLSQEALGSGWVKLERSTVLFRDPTNIGRRLIPVLLSDCTLPDTLRRYKYIDFRRETDEAFTCLLTACRLVTNEASSRSVLTSFGDDKSRVRSGGYFRIVVDFPSFEIGRLVFIYGSLLDVDSLRSTIMRSSRRVDCVPVRLKGYRLRWGAPSARLDYVLRDWTRCEEHFRWLSLLIEKVNSGDDTVHGAVINVDNETEYSELCARERSYAPHELPCDCLFRLDGTLYDPPSPVIAFIRDQFIDKPSSRYRIRQGYPDRVNKGLLEIGKQCDSSFLVSVQPTDPIIGPIKTIDAFAVNDLVHDTMAIQHYKLEALYGEVKNMLVRDGAMWQTEADKRPRPISTALCPIILPEEVFADAKCLAEAAVSLTSKATLLAVGNDELSNFCRFDIGDREFARLALDRGDDHVQVTRVDMTYDRGTLRVFEVNSDSPGGMYHFDKLTSRFSGYMSSLGIGHLETVAPNLCEAVVDQLLMRWRQNGCPASAVTDRGGDPLYIGIMEHDFVRWQSLPEMLNLQALLRKRANSAANVFLCEASTLEYDGVDLTGIESRIRIEKEGIFHDVHDRLPISLVYKRVLHKDLKPKGSEGVHKEKLIKASTALMRAYRDNRICIVNSPFGLLTGNKSILAIIHLCDFERRLISAGLPGLTADERRLIEALILPPTYAWRDQLDSSTKFNLRDLVLNEEGPCFVIKPFDEHSGHGLDIKFRRGWQRRFKDLWNSKESPCIVQEFVPHGRVTVPVIDEAQRELVERQMYFILGVYVVGGKAMGIEAKVGDDLPISMRVDKRGPRGYRTIVYPLKG